MLIDTIIVRTRQPGDLHYIDLRQDNGIALSLGPYQNPWLAERDAKQLRAYIERLVGRATREEHQHR